MIKIICFILISILSLSINLNAEGVVGNGGNIIVCKDTSSLNHNKLLELYEMDLVYGYTSNKSLMQKNETEQVHSIITEKLIKHQSKFSLFIKEYLSRFDEDKLVIGDRFSDSNDAVDAIYPENCELETVVYQRNSWPYYVLSPSWFFLNSYNRAALSVHEVIYRFALEENSELISSKAVRNVTAYLFSNEFMRAKNYTELNKLLEGLK